ncbi:hypothetical protein [Alloactinosynnema sp. L-07]|nr:hypothetical protein [Alloactinosynnema sp. L-07]
MFAGSGHRGSITELITELITEWWLPSAGVRGIRSMWVDH